MLTVFGVAKEGVRFSTYVQNGCSSSIVMKEDGAVQLLRSHPLVSSYCVPCMGMIGMLVSPCAYALCTKASNLAGLLLITVIRSVVSSVTLLLSNNLSTSTKTMGNRQSSYTGLD